MLLLFAIDVNVYQVKILMLYDIQNTNVIFVGTKMRNVVNGYSIV